MVSPKTITIYCNPYLVVARLDNQASAKASQQDISIVGNMDSLERYIGFGS